MCGKRCSRTGERAKSKVAAASLPSRCPSTQSPAAGDRTTTREALLLPTAFSDRITSLQQCTMHRTLLLVLLPHASCLQPLRQVYYDWVALNARSTTRHIMKPATTAGREELLLLKQQLRADVAAGSFVVDAFASAASVSTDEESCQNGGLIGRRLRQGTCILPELDRACFTAPLGEVAGPLRSKEGYHLVLVEERLGLEMHDGGNTRVVVEPAAGDSGGVRSVLKPADPADDGNELLSPVNLVTLVVSLLLVGVLGDAITTVASSVAF